MYVIVNLYITKNPSVKCFLKLNFENTVKQGMKQLYLSWIKGNDIGGKFMTSENV